MKKTILSLFFISIIAIPASVSAQQTLTLTTYYPAPFGAYDRLRLVPHDDVATPITCDNTTTGMLYVKDDGANYPLQYCDGTSFGPLAGVWTQNNIDAANAEVYLTDQTRQIFVGIGTTVPTVPLEVRGTIIAGGRTLSAIHQVLDGSESIIIPGNFSDYLIQVQDGNGRIQHKWNAGYAPGETYLVDGEPAWFWNVGIITDPYMEFNYAPGGTAGTVIPWETHMVFMQNGDIGIGTTVPTDSLDVNGFVNVDESSGYKQAGETILFSPFSNKGLFAGRGAGANILSPGGDYNTFLGYSAGMTTTSADRNVFVGFEAGKNSNGSDENTFVGYQAGYNTTSATGNNTFIGREAGRGNTTGAVNTFIGSYAGFGNTIGNYNIYIGKDTSRTNTSGSENVFIGYQAGKDNVAGKKNVVIGSEAGYSGSLGDGNVLIGHNAGYNASGNSHLYIANTSGMPLIYGNFATNRVGIGTTSPEGILHVQGADDTEEIVTFMPGDDTAAAGDPDLHVGIGTTTPQPWNRLQVAGGTTKFASYTTSPITCDGEHAGAMYFDTNISDTGGQDLCVCMNTGTEWKWRSPSGNCE